MKMAKRILSLVLDLVRFASLSVTAFADTASTNTATVVIKANGVEIDRGSAPAGQSVYAYLVATYGNPSGWSEFVDINGDTAMALNTMKVKGTDYTNCAIDGSTTAIQVERWGTITGYGLVSTVKSGDTITEYNFIYVGNSWVYSVKNAAGTTVDVESLYMNQYAMSAGDVVTVEFGLVESRWSSSEPIIPQYPYC